MSYAIITPSVRASLPGYEQSFVDTYGELWLSNLPEGAIEMCPQIRYLVEYHEFQWMNAKLKVISAMLPVITSHGYDAEWRGTDGEYEVAEVKVKKQVKVVFKDGVTINLPLKAAYRLDRLMPGDQVLVVQGHIFKVTKG